MLWNLWRLKENPGFSSSLSSQNIKIWTTCVSQVQVFVFRSQSICHNPMKAVHLMQHRESRHEGWTFRKLFSQFLSSLNCMLEKQTALNWKMRHQLRNRSQQSVKEKSMTLENTSSPVIANFLIQGGVRIAAYPWVILKSMLTQRDSSGFFELLILIYESCLRERRRALEDLEEDRQRPWPPLGPQEMKSQ